MRIAPVMTRLLTLFLIFLNMQLVAEAQSADQGIKHISFLLDKMEYWHKNSGNDTQDSLTYFNDKLEEYLLKFTSNNAASLSCNFKPLENKSFNVQTSPDGNFRVYNWNTLTGGTMQFFRSIYQYKVNGSVFSKSTTKDKEDNGCYYFDLNQVTVDKTPYYILCSVSIGSTAVFYYKAEVLSLQQDVLKEDAKLIKTKSGMQHSVGYEVDLSSSVNRDLADARDNMKMEYDKERDAILLALLSEDGKVTSKKIRYTFNGRFFERK
jgi:hypothetical protein